jgi:hypothetical protein
MDRLLDLQNEAFTLGNAPLSGLGVDLVLQGCAVTNNGNGTVNIAPGLILVNSLTLRFAGAANIAADGSQAFIAGPPVTSAPKPFADGSIKNIYSESMAIVSAEDPSNSTQIKIGLTLYNLQEYITDQVYQSESKGTIKEVYDLDGTFLDNFNDTGLGVTRRWLGWALDNAGNGTPGSAGMAIIAVGTYTDPVTGLQTVYAPGQKLGETAHKLVMAELPAAGIPIPASENGTANGSRQKAAWSDNEANDQGNITSGNLGLGTAHNNMQPSVATYRAVKIV